MLLLLLFLGAGCSVNADKGNQPNVSEEFQSYWYQGKAEISSYTLEQAQYGEIYKGNAVLIFVSEHFSKSGLHKLNNPEVAGNDAVGVLKLNHTKNFTTGIYPYSLMLSAFTPVNRLKHQHSLKTTTSLQEWCGHSYTQLSLKNGKYEYEQFSYFDGEGEKNYQLDQAILEDEIWNLIRLNPANLPVGKISLIPSSFSVRLRHQELKVENAVAELKQYEQKSKYRIEYPDRVLSIEFQNEFPYIIEGWEETYESGSGENRKMLTTRAKRNTTMLSDYWSKNSNADLHLRDSLELPR